MSRRYLSISEAESALKRGKSVELFLGGFDSYSTACIRWASFSNTEQGVSGHVWESVDEGSEDYFDIYSFSLLNGEYDEPSMSVLGSNLPEVISKLSLTELRFVNAGVVQDEYGDFKLKNT
jgi:hypothetical protein